MLWNARSFVYAGTNSDDFEIAIGYLDSPDFDDNGLKREVSKSDTSMLRRKANVYGVKDEDPIIFKFHIFPDTCKRTEEWSVIESHKINQWLLSPTTPKTLIFNDENDEINIQYRAIVTEILDVPGAKGCAGKTITFECDSPFGYSVPREIIGECDGTKILSIDNIGDEEFAYCNYEIEFLDANTVIINNSTINETIELLAKTGTKIKYDGEHNMLFDANNDVLPFYKVVNSNNINTELRLQKGKNIITLKGKFKYKITITYALRYGIM